MPDYESPSPPPEQPTNQSADSASLTPAPRFWGFYALGVYLLAVTCPLVIASFVAAITGITTSEAGKTIHITAGPLVQIILAAGTIWTLRRLNFPISQAGILWQGKPREWRHIGQGVLLGLGISVFAFVYGLVLSLLHLKIDPLAPYKQGLSSPLLTAIFVISAVFLAPVAEELFYRGFVLTMFARNHSRWWAIIVTSLLFALAHLLLVAFVQLFVFAILLSILRLKSKSLVAPIVAHSINNLISVVILLFR